MSSTLSLILYGLFSICIIVVMMVLSYLLGQKHSERATSQQFESGIKATGSAQLRTPIHFYIVAMFFLVFDIESIFIISWAISYKSSGWIGYWGMLIFVIILFSVLFYEWRSGALNFGPKGNEILKAYKKQKRLKQ